MQPLPETVRAGKRRNSVTVWLLWPALTLGIYHLVWYFKVNRETRDLGVPARPGVSVLAVTLGALIIVPPFVSYYHTGERIAQAQRAARLAPTCIAVIGLILTVFLFGSGTAYYQAELNKIWEHYGNPPEGAHVTLASARPQDISN